MKLPDVMHWRIGGWTRIWIVLSTLFFVLSYLSASNDYASAVSIADSDYKKTTEWIKWARQNPAEAAKLAGDCATETKDDTNEFRTKIVCLRTESQSPNMQEAAEERDSAKAAALANAWDDGLSLGGMPSIVLGILFLSVGWIRRGFAVKQMPQKQ